MAAWRCTTVFPGTMPPCCTTCVSSCASSRYPPVSGANSPAQRNSWPAVNALAWIARADSAAWRSVCTRTWLKSGPKRGSKNARTDGGKAARHPAEWQSANALQGWRATARAFPCAELFSSSAFLGRSLHPPHTPRIFAVWPYGAA